MPAASTFKSIAALTMKIHIVDKCHAAFIHYYVMLESVNADFQTKLLINYAITGSLVCSGNQKYRTATGFYLANLSPGYYTIKVHYKLPVAINMPADWDWQTAILQVVWAKDTYAVSNDIKCDSFTHTTTGVPLETLKLLYICLVTESSCQLTNSQLRCHLPVTLLQP